MSSTRTSFRAWVKDMHQAWSRHIVIVSVAAVIFCVAQKPILARLSFSPKILFAPLSENEFAAFVIVLLLYLLKREWGYRKIYVPRPVSLWLFFLLGGYLYDRHWEGSFSFWTIPYFRQVAWSDLLLLPWGLAVAIALRSWIRGQFWFLSVVLTLLSIVLYFLPREQGLSLFGWGSIGAFIAMGSCLLVYVILSFSKAWTSPQNKPQEPYQTEPSYQPIDTDDALERRVGDWLGFSNLAKTLAWNLCSLDLNKRSLTVGVVAPWGKGKSSFINFLKEQLEKEDGIIITFNPRGSKSVSSIPEDFFDVFAKELSQHYLGFGLLLARYTKHLGLLNQYAWTHPLGSLLTLLLPGKEQEAVNRTLRVFGRRIYVVIDDLDRLSAEEILEVLKLIDRNASFSNTVFITAYDKAYVNNVLKSRLDHGLNHSFIDKYIAMEFPLPEPNKEGLKQIMKVLLARKVRTYKSSLCKQIQRDWDQVADIVVESLDSVRDLKRYLNLVILRYNEVIEKVDCEDYFLLYLLCFKDFSVYAALNSRRILQIDSSKGWYVLAPNFEEELYLISKWEGTKSILEKLFPLKCREKEKWFFPRSLRSTHWFSFYFQGDETTGSAPYADIVSEIVSCGSESDPYAIIDAAIKEWGIDQVINAFLYQVKSPTSILEERAQTIKLMAYVAIQYVQPERGVNILQEELAKLLSEEGYRMYKKLGIIQNRTQYQELLEPMLSMGIDKRPLWISDLVKSFDLFGEVDSHECIYSLDGMAEILLRCQRSYYSRWEADDDSREIALSFVSGEYLCGYPPLREQARKELVSLINRCPDGCLWMLMTRRYERERWAQMKASTKLVSRISGDYDSCLDAKAFSLSIAIGLIKGLEEDGFSLDAWLAGMKNWKGTYIFNYVRGASGEPPLRRIDLLPDEEADLHSIDYIYRAVLAQEERDRQQASSEG